MSLDSHKIFNPRQYPTDVLSAFTKYVRKFNYIYDGENRTVPTAHTEPDAIASWKEEDKAKLFLSRAVSDEFLDDFESAVIVTERTNIKFTALVEKMKTRYTPSSNKVKNHYLFLRLTQKSSETFNDFAFRVKAEAELCDFKCESNDCTIKNTLIRSNSCKG